MRRTKVVRVSCWLFFVVILIGSGPIWGSEFSGAPRGGSDFYESSYINSVASGQTTDGTVFTLVTGKHQLYWPYFHPQSKWDNILLQIGDQGFFLSRQEIEPLNIAINPQAGMVQMAFSGSLNNAAGGTSLVEFNLSMGAFRFPARDKMVKFLGTRIGMIWQPYEIKSLAGGEFLRADGREYEVDRVYGELETGEFSWSTDPRFAVKYDYVTVAYPALESFDADSYAYINFRAGLLHADDFLSRLLSDLIRLFGSEDVTIKASTTLPRNVERVDLSPSAPEVLFEDIIDLGMARLQRQLIRTTDGRQNSVFGLREIFTPIF